MTGIGRLRKYDARDARRGETLLERGRVIFGVRHRRIDMIGDPARKLEPARVNRPCGKQRVIEATQTHTNDQDYGQHQLYGEIGCVLAVIERNTESADAFHYDDVGVRGKLAISGHDRAQFDGDPRCLRRDVRRDWQLEAIGVEQSLRRRNAAGGGKLRDILVAQFGAVAPRARSDRFHAGRAQAACRERVQECARSQCFADAGIGAGDEKTVTGDG